MTGTVSMTCPQHLPLDGTLGLTVSGLDPGSPVALAAALETSDGIRWTSGAQFVADAGGTVRTEAQCPVGGDYDRVDGNGLLWSLAPDDVTRAEASTVIGGPEPLTVRIVATSGPARLGQATVVIDQRPPGVRQEPVRVEGLVGELFVPEGTGPFPPVLVVGGSGGDANEGLAAFLAGHGYLALALSYFSAPGLPSVLVDIDIEYFERGIGWLTSRTDSRGPVAVVGRSRGGELSLLLGCVLGIEMVVAFVPSPIVHAGITSGPDGWLSNLPSWRRRGQPVPYMAHDDGRLYQRHGAVACTPTYLDCLADWDRAEAAMMPLENCPSAVLLISGADDQVWPSALYSELAMARLRRRAGGRQRHLMLAGAGHRFNPPVLPSTLTVVRHAQANDRILLGGSAAANAAAGAAAYREMLVALDRSGPAEAWT
jgi:dienelactone hydrolase